MKQLTIILLLVVTTLCVAGCASDTSTGYVPPATEKPCGTFDGYQLYKDGSSCYYYEDAAKTKKRYLNAGNCEC
jgi:hypothetical protein